MLGIAVSDERRIVSVEGLPCRFTFSPLSSYTPSRSKINQKGVKTPFFPFVPKSD